MMNVLSIYHDRAFFSDKTPNALRRILGAAIRSDESEKTEKLLLQARLEWPQEADTHISLYKYYFVSGRYNDAESAVWVALRTAALMAGFNRNYRLLTPSSANWASKVGAERLYLFSLKALGVCRLRRGRVDAARSVLKKLSELDPFDEVGGGSFLTIAESFFDDE